MTGDDDGHPILTTVGVVAVAVGLLLMFVPGFAAAIGTGYAAVTVVGLLALVQAVRVARSRMATELRAAETDDVETVEAMPTPGEEFDRTVAELRSGPRRNLIRERSDLRDTLETAALTAVADRENCSRDQARDRIETGAWTDDPHAATFLGGPDAPSPPLADRVKIAASTQSPFQYRIRRTADAVARTAGVEDEDDSQNNVQETAGRARASETDEPTHSRADESSRMETEA
ncbi:DUF7269 family protein [Halorussus pelagicus]|uniref:DUF7269 family protein n=1 Tax=Halorussus pelagicus TaxID=2505977 RepID=UPI000FFB826E|nr:hypothetical protein [Halorussus pelagicus]